MTALKVFIFTFNRPDLLQRQLDSLKKYLVGDYNINVIYDYREDSFGEQFKKICDDNQVNLHAHKSNPGNVPSGYHADSLTWTYENLIQDGDYVMFLDHDIFLIDYFDLESRLDKFDISGLKQTRLHVDYLWPGLFMFKYSSIKDIEFDFYQQNIEGQSLDSGGGTYKLVRNKDLKINFVSQEYPEFYKNLNITDPTINNGHVFEILDDNTFLHTHNACNWHNNYEASGNDKKKTEVIFSILNDILDDKGKDYLEIVVARYSEDLGWTEDHKDFVTVYNKGDDEVDGSISLKNIGRESHTYLYHIVNNYDNLSEYTCFLQGDPNPHTSKLDQFLEYILESNELIPEFFWISNRIVNGDFEYKKEPYFAKFKNIKYAYEKIFDKKPEIDKFTFGAGAQFCVSKNRIRQRPLSFYKNILDIFEHNPGDELDELSLKLLGNAGLSEDFKPSDPELGLYMERFWGLILNDV